MNPSTKQRQLGLLAACVAILAFSIGSTFVKLAQIPGRGITTPGITIAFWRMIVCAIGWAIIMRLVDKRWLNSADIKVAALPGALFGCNIMAFFTGVTRTSVPHAEFIGSMTPFLLVPLGAMLFGEAIRVKALLFGVISLIGLALVLFFGANTSGATVAGDLFVVLAMCLWTSYLLTTRTVRQGRSVSSLMAGMMPIAAIVTLPIPLFTGNLDNVTWRAVPFILLLAVTTGTAAHGCVVYAQQTVPVGTFSLMQVSQPAIAVVWSVLFLSQTIRAIQVIGMVLVIGGLVAVTVLSRRPAVATLDATSGELAGSAG